ncbi:SAM-dependent methyltransferase [Streptomyces sp. M19]
MSGHEPGLSRIDTSKPHPARVYDYILGGKNNYPVDEALAKQVIAIDPTVPNTARINRAFMNRATSWLAGQGVRQFLDIGTGIPTEPNLHQIAQEIAPEARVVYTDNDPIVLRHAEALLRSTPEGVTDYIEADIREPRKIVELAAEAIDFSRPVALSLISLMHFIPDEEDAYGLVGALVDALSRAATSSLARDRRRRRGGGGAGGRAVRRGRRDLRPRTRAEVTRFFEGWNRWAPGGARLGLAAHRGRGRARRPG